MAASSSDLFRKTTSGTRPEPAYLTAQKTVGSTSITTNTTTGWATDTGIDFVIYRKDTTNQVVPGSVTTWVGVVSGAGSITSMVLKAGTEPAGGYPQGELSVVEAMPTAAWSSALIAALLNQHTQTGAHGAITATSLATLGATTSGGLLTASNGLSLTSGTLSLPSASINQAALPLGAVVQIASTTYSAVATGTTQIPKDDTIPQNTEGDQYMTQAITPKSSTNRLLIRAKAFLSSSVANDLTAALFQDSTANALAAQASFMATANGEVPVVIDHDMAAGTTASTTFRVRCGGGSPGTTTFNGVSGARLYGGITLSNITIIEYKA